MRVISIGRKRERKKDRVIEKKEEKREGRTGRA